MKTSAERVRAGNEIARLEQAWRRAKAPDAKRVLDAERNGLMAALQVREGAELEACTAEAIRVRGMWEGL